MRIRGWRIWSAHAFCQAISRPSCLELPGTPGFADVAIAATAKLRDFTILTHNARRFEPPGVPLLDPFVQLPPARPPPP